MKNLIEGFVALKLAVTAEGARKIVQYVFGSHEILDFNQFYVLFQTQPAMDRSVKLVTQALKKRIKKEPTQTTYFRSNSPGFLRIPSLRGQISANF